MVSARVLVTAVLPFKKNHSFSIRSKMLFFAPILLFFAMFWGPTSAHANDIYFAQNAAGAANGSSCANALPVSFFNSSSNWGTGTSQIGPGTTVHLCGTFTGTAGQTLLTSQGSGTSGSPITLLFESGANLTSPYWGPGGGAIHITGRSWITVDGATNGLIENTQNGTGLAFNAQTNLLVISNSSNITIKNLTIKNACQRAAGDVGDSCTTGGNDSGSVNLTGPATNVTITRNTISMGGHGCLWYDGSATDSGIVFSNNTISGCNWGIGGSGSTNGLTITGNDITCVAGAVCNWDDAADANHHNGIMLFPQNGQTYSNLVISNNFIHDVNGHTTAHIFLDPSGTGSLPSVQIYNNVLYTTPGQTGPANNFIEPAGTAGAVVYNNTMSGNAYQAIGLFTNDTTKNNIVVGSGKGTGANSGITGVASGYNDYYGLTCSGGGCYVLNGSGCCSGGLSQFTAGSTAVCSPSGCDVNSVTVNPVLDASLMLTSSSPAAVHTGINLTSLGISGLDVSAPQFFGVSYACGTGCVARPSTGAWDMGAYQYSTTTGGQQPNPPSGLTALVQ